SVTTDCVLFFFSSRRRHTRSKRDWSSDVCSSDLITMVRIHKVFDYRQAETGTARVSGTCFIHSVETFENPGDTFFRDAYTGVAYIYMNIVFGHFHRYVYSAAFACVVYRIGDEVQQYLVEPVAVPFDVHFFC